MGLEMMEVSWFGLRHGGGLVTTVPEDWVSGKYCLMMGGHQWN
jgi:hypothetical protein